MEWLLPALRMLTNTELAAELNAWAIHFLRSDQVTNSLRRVHPALLMAALARSDEARLRLALIPRLLRRPELADHVDVCLLSDRAERVTFMCYYRVVF